ncbi:MAG: Gfo/Idh/MocA family oxidoreductase [Pirellulales bacterium]
MPNPSRRTFLRTAVAGAAALGLPAPVRAARSANEELRFGLIGCGIRGGAFLERAAMVCDPDQSRLDAAAKSAGVAPAQAVTDLRRILDNPDIDAVVIAAPDHWHAPAAILACQAGKHVYVEKPCSHNFRESQLLVVAARRNKVVVQHGTQQRSREFTANAIQSLREGLIGDVLVAKAWNIQRRKDIGHAKPAAVPAGVDYDLWVGPAEMVPFQPNRFHSDWHWWYNFGTGDVGNDGAHEIDYARWGLGVDTLPTKISAIGGKYFFDDDQQFPDTATCVWDFPAAGDSGPRRQLVFEMRLWSKNYPYNCDSGVEFFGTKGRMMLSKRGKLIVVDDDNKTIHDAKANDEQGWIHFDNFADAIRNNTRPNADILEGHRTVGLIHLANIAIRVGRSLDFDPATEQIVRDAEASQLLTRTYRQDGHWAKPQGI